MISTPCLAKGDDVDVLSRAGEEGWELVAILVNNMAYLKRPLAPEPDDEATKATGEPEPKYRDSATGETWSGRGRMARWLKVRQDAGEDIEKYRVQ